MFIWRMNLSLERLDYKQKIRFLEVAYLFVIAVVVPLCMGPQIFDKFSHSISYIVLNISQLPAIIFFYRVYLEKILFKRKPVISILTFSLFILAYEINCRLSYFFFINVPLMPQTYIDKLKLGNPGSLTELTQNVGYTCLVFLTGFALVMTKRLLAKQEEVHELQYDKLKLELDHLKSQLQPHFFFNTLNNLYTLSIQQSDKAPKMIASLSAIMRYVLYESKEEKVSLNREIQFMHNYFELERIRHTDPGQIEFIVQGNPDGKEIEPLLFLPLIENCFKHALQRDVSENPVKMVLAIDDHELVFQTSNKILEKEKPSVYGGIGLNNIKKRLQLLYGERQQLDLEVESGHFIATISLQI